MSDTKLREKADALIAFTQQGPRFIAWVEAVTDSIAPEPEKVAKVETMADRIAADLKAGTFRGEQPAPPEPAAREMPEAVRKAIQDLHDWADTYESDLLPREIAYTRSVADALETFWRAHHAQPVAVGMSEEEWNALTDVMIFAAHQADLMFSGGGGSNVRPKANAIRAKVGVMNEWRLYVRRSFSLSSGVDL